MLKRKIFLNSFLLSEQDSTYRWYTWHGSLTSDTCVTVPNVITVSRRFRTSRFCLKRLIITPLHVYTFCNWEAWSYIKHARYKTKDLLCFCGFVISIETFKQCKVTPPKKKKLYKLLHFWNELLFMNVSHRKHIHLYRVYVVYCPAMTAWNFFLDKNRITNLLFL